MENNLVEISYKFFLDEGFVEYPLILSIDRPFLNVICKDSQNVIGKFKLSNLLSFKNREYPWDHSNVYHKSSNLSDLEYCKSIIKSGFYNDELRLMISMPYVGDYRVFASFKTMEDPDIESVLISKSLKNFNEGNHLGLDELKVGDIIPFPSSASLILNLVWYDEEGSAFPQSFYLENLDVSIKVSGVSPELKGPENLPLKNLVQGRYFIDLKSKRKVLLSILRKRMRVAGMEDSPEDFLDLFYKYLKNGFLYVNPSSLRFQDKTSEKRLPDPK